jgi:RNA polymerase sigma-70 factor, ECF subfamily
MISHHLMEATVSTDYLTTARKAIEAARERWPQLQPDPEALAAFLANPGESDAEPGSNDMGDVPLKHPDELVLAYQCAQGSPVALAIIEKEYLSEIPRYVSRIDSASDFADELTQQLRERLLVADQGGRPRILTYTGRGPLGGWLRVVAVRIALTQKSQRKHSSDDDVGDLADLALPADEELVRRDNHEPFQQALRNAIARLSTRERNILRLRFVDNWSPEDIGKSYGVHRATVARWISALRDTVKTAMAEELRSTLGFRASEFASLLNLIESRLHLSLSRLD